jgi:glycosyltransferase involved in cell wall biosynthesis
MIVSALRLFARRRRARGIVTGGGLDGMVFAWLQAWIPWGRKPHVLVDCNWYEPSSELGRRFRSWQVRQAYRSASRFVVWARHEVEDYSRSLRVPPDKFAYVPFHPTLHDYEFAIRDDGYLFAGGNYDRDYPMLVEAVAGLDVPVWIATTRKEQLTGLALPANVRVEGTTHAGFRQAMAAARIVVVPMQAGLLHSGGQQTLLNALALGKPTIAVGRNWATDFVTDGEHALVVDYEDVAGLRRAIRRLLEQPAEAAALAERGRRQAERFSTRRCMETIYRLALDGQRSLV